MKDKGVSKWTVSALGEIHEYTTVETANMIVATQQTLLLDKILQTLERIETKLDSQSRE